MSSLVKDTAKGFAWTTLERILTYVIQFAIGIIINPIRSKKISAPTRGANLFKN